MSPRVQGSHLLARCVAGALYVVLMGGSWDFWWHGTIPRESFWAPPHLLIQAGVIAAIALGAYGWMSTRDRGWKRLAIALAVIPFTAPIDDLWHRAFGVEQVGTVMIFWSPPHLALLVAIVVALAQARSVVRREPDPIARAFFMGLLAAATLHILFYYAYPVEPLGPFHLMGFAGTVVLGMLLASCLIAARAANPTVGSATMTVAFYIVLAVMQFVEKPGPDIVVAPYTYPPGWLYVFAFTLPAFAVDLLHERLSLPVLGGTVGLLYAAVLYGFSSPFLPASFRYDFVGASIAVLAGIAGGVGGGFLEQVRGWMRAGHRVFSPSLRQAFRGRVSGSIARLLSLDGQVTTVSVEELPPAEQRAWEFPWRARRESNPRPEA